MWEETYRRSEERKAARASALAWSQQLSLPHSLAWLERADISETLRSTTQLPNYPITQLPLDIAAAQCALHALFAADGFPTDTAGHEILWRRDPLGKPFVEWTGSVEAWAAERGRAGRHLHVSNTHDGDAHLVLAAYAPSIVGVGVDVVHLPRLRRAGKGRDYLLAFARRFMATGEWEGFLASAEGEDEEALRLRVAAHFSLMEAASKALGTGLILGMGMGRSTSLPKQALGVLRLAPAVEFAFGPEAEARLAALGATTWEGFWGADGDYLVSTVVLSCVARPGVACATANRAIGTRNGEHDTWFKPIL